MFERRLYHHIDWVLIGAVLAICALGLAMIYSATGGASRVYWTQVYALGLGLVAMMICLAVDYRSLADKSHWIYLAMMLLLAGVLFFGAVRGGSRRWIDLGSLNLQPSEFAKAVLALMLAKMLGEERRPALTNNDLFIAASLTAVPFLLIVRQPDLGTAATLLPILLVVAYVAGMPMKYVYIGALVAVLAAPIAYRFALQDYQRERIATFLDPAQDPRGAGYQQIQAASLSAPAACGVKASWRARRASCGSSRFRTTTSSSRCSPRSRGWSVCSSHSGFTCSSSCVRWRRPGWPRIASAPI
jgi:rod shape determining protein RodA